MGAPERDNDLLLVLLIAVLVGNEDDPFVDQLLYERIQERLRRSELFDPEIEHLLERALRYPMRRRRRDRLGETREVAISVVEGFRKSFEEATTERIERNTKRLDDSLRDSLRSVSDQLESLSNTHKKLSNAVSEQRELVRALNDDVASYLWLSGTGADISRVQIRRHIPVRVYLSDPVPESNVLHELVYRIVALYETIGFEKADEFPEESGSWWKRLILKSKEVLTSEDVTNRVSKAERAVEVAYLDKPQAEANQHQAEAASSLIAALGQTSTACIQVGSLLLVKASGPEVDNCIIARTLTRAEIKHLEENQSMLKQPEEILEWLQTNEQKRLTSRSSRRS